MCLSELSVVGEMADLTRTGLLPSAQEVAALSLHFGLPVTHQTTHEHSPDPTHPTPPPDHVPTQSKRVWQPLELSNSLYEKFLRDKKTERPDFVHRNIVSVRPHVVGVCQHVLPFAVARGRVVKAVATVEATKTALSGAQ